MKYVALLSGGKDSCYNLLHCHKNGHELVAAASLGPEFGREELDSYLYQTVGQDAIHLVADALEVPLYRRVISGYAVEQGPEYGHRNTSGYGEGVQGDETEDLYALLSTVKCHHPDIQGVSVGAILSNYQRVRVEHVCRRLSLTPLCYLWQRDQGELLSEMIDSGMEAILIKVAGIGLTVKHLGKSLSDMQETLIKLNELYGSHICGEGGEYETLTIDCPLFKSRIKMITVQNVIHSDNDIAPVAFLRIKDAILERRPPPDFDIRLPPLLESRFNDVQQAVLDFRCLPSDFGHAGRSSSLCPTYPKVAVISRRLNSWIAIVDVHCARQDHDQVSIEDEVRQCFKILGDELSAFSLTLSHIANINVFLSSMAHFVPLNAVYTTYFGVSPPARACVSVDLPPGVRVKLDCIAFAEQTPVDRQALHVQGLSYWAPANIGPYSQAITVNERVFISGQIGLVPSNLSLPSGVSLAQELALSCQHVERVARAMRANSGGWDGHAQTVLYWLSEASGLKRIKEGCKALVQEANVPCLFLVVKALPKEALVEKQVLLHTGRCFRPGSDGEEASADAQSPRFERGDISIGSIQIHWEITGFEGSTASCAIICLRGEGNLTEIASRLKAAISFDQIWDRTLSIRLFHDTQWATPITSFPEALYGATNLPPITSIACRLISSREVDDWDYALWILGT